MKLLFMALSLCAGLAYAKTVHVDSINGRVKVQIEMSDTGGPLDILFVIDNSGSMQSHQVTVMNNARAFIEKISQGNSDWKIGLISTTEGDRPFGGFEPGTEISGANPNSVDRFMYAVNSLGTSGDSTETVFYPIVNVLGTHPDFLRTGAQLDVIVISDASEQSSLSPADFVSKLKMLGVDINRTSLHAFINPNDWCAPTDDQWNMAGSPYEALSSMMTTDYSKLCDPNMGRNLVALGAELGSRPKSGGGVVPSTMRIPLPSQPDFYSIRVTYGSQEIQGGDAQLGWMWDNSKNEIVLGNKIAWQTQPAGTPLEVTYVPYDWK